MAVNTLDKYYTPQWLIDHQIKKTLDVVGRDNIKHVIEPSAGDGAYIRGLSEAFKGIDIEYYDLYPEHPQITRQDYLGLRKTYRKGRLIIGNPPYGTASNLWRAFCKKSARIGDYISFISPASQYNSNYYFPEGELVYSELLNDVEYLGSATEGGKNQKVRTCLNIYKVFDREETDDPRDALIKSKLKFGAVFKDENGEQDDYEYYLASMTSGSKTHCTLCEKGDFYGLFGVTVLDESIRDKMEEFLDGFKQYSKELMSRKSSAPLIDKAFFMMKLKPFLYPTREERLDQDVKVDLLDRRDPLVDDKLDKWDWYIYRFGKIGQPTQTPTKDTFAIRILNEDVRNDVDRCMGEIDEKYIPDILKRTTGTPVLSKFVLKDILKVYLYPNRDERLDQDVEIRTILKFSEKDGRHSETNGIREPNWNEYEYFICKWGEAAGTISKTPEYAHSLALKVVNENIRNDVEKALNEYKEEYHTRIKRAERTINVPMFREYLKSKLYPNRSERLDQDVEIKSGNPDGYDFYLGKWGEGPVGKFKETNDFSDSWGIRILNEDVRDKVKQFCISFNEKYGKDIREKSNGMPAIKRGYLLEKLKVHLYPTRDERLDQDIALVKEREDADFIVVAWGQAALLTDEEYVGNTTYNIKVLNEDVRDKLSKFLPKFRTIFVEDPKNQLVDRGHGDEPKLNLNKPELKDYLKKHLYPTRDERLEQDVLITNDDADYYIVSWGHAGKLVTDLEKYKFIYGIKVLNEDIRSKCDELMPRIRDIFTSMDQFRRANRDGRNTPEHQTNISLPVFKDILKKHLYPTRDERLDQDVEVKIVNFLRDGTEKHKDYDYYVSKFGTIGALGDKGGIPICIKILNEDVREGVEKTIESLKNLQNYSSGVPTLNVMTFKDILKKQLYPTRDEQLDRDVLISRSFEKEEDWDFYTTRWGHLGDIQYEYDIKKGPYCVKILNEDVRDNLMKAMEDLKEYTDKNMQRVGSGPSMNKQVFKKYLMKKLYPTRDERFQQDVELVDEEADFHIVAWGDLGRISDKKETTCTWNLKFHNDEIKQRFDERKEQISEALRNHPSRSVKIGGGSTNLAKHYMIDVLKKHLYPTREEKLEQDIRISVVEKREGILVNGSHGIDGPYKEGDWEYFISSFGHFGVILNVPQYSTQIAINILNEDVREKFEKFLQNIQTHLKENHEPGAAFVNTYKLKDLLKKHLYPVEDTTIEIYTPSWEEEYNIKKQIKIEREIHSKALF